MEVIPFQMVSHHYSYRLASVRKTANLTNVRPKGIPSPQIYVVKKNLTLRIVWNFNAPFRDRNANNAALFNALGHRQSANILNHLVRYIASMP